MVTYGCRGYDKIDRVRKFNTRLFKKIISDTLPPEVEFCHSNQG
jgi:hypothetical protein